MHQIHLEILIIPTEGQTVTIQVAAMPITLPFVPYPGLTIVLSEWGEEMGGDFCVGSVSWDNLHGAFVCIEEMPLLGQMEAEVTIEGLKSRGWTVETKSSVSP